MLLPIAVLNCLNKLQSNGFSAYIVGGCVRDSILGIEPHDWDLCTCARPNEICNVFSEYKTVLTGVRYGTVTVIIENNFVEITTFRTDGEYLNHRKPEQVLFTSTLVEDLKRRDFTINAIAYNPDEGLIDPFNGLGDISAGIVRCVGDPECRFMEDALRIMRMFRFAAQLDFNIENSTFQASINCKNILKHISGERINSELNKILLCKKPAKILSIMAETGVIAEFIPEFSPCIGFRQNTPYHNLTVSEHIFKAVELSKIDLIIRLALFLHDISKPQSYWVDSDNIGHFKGHEKLSSICAKKILTRLHYNKKTIAKVSQLIEIHNWDIYPDNKHLRRILAKLGEETSLQLLNLCIADTLAKNTISAEPRLKRLLKSKKILEDLILSNPSTTMANLAINGKDLMELGITNGLDIGKTLKYLLELVIEDESLNTKEILIQIAVEYKNK